MSVVWIVIPALLFVLIKQFMDNRAAAQKEKLRILETALRDGSMDDAAREDLVEVLTGRKRRRPATPAEGQVGLMTRFIVLVGWLALCLGVAFTILGVEYRCEDYLLAGVILICAGFGLVTYTFVIRELQSGSRRRDAGQAGHHRA